MKRWTTALVPVLTLALTTAAWACPMCKDSIANSDAQQPGGVPGGFNTTIYFMLGSLFCVIDPSPLDIFTIRPYLCSFMRGTSDRLRAMGATTLVSNVVR